jgi:hypothetical protein
MDLETMIYIGCIRETHVECKETQRLKDGEKSCFLKIVYFIHECIIMQVDFYIKNVTRKVSIY